MKNLNLTITYLILFLNLQFEYLQEEKPLTPEYATVQRVKIMELEGNSLQHLLSDPLFNQKKL